MTNIFSIIKTADIFGRPIQLNWTQDGKSYKTFKSVLGGLMSCVLAIFLAIFLGFLINDVFHSRKDEMTSFEMKRNQNKKTNYHNEMDI